MNIGMLPLLGVAILVWGGIFAFLLGLERRVAGLERQISNEEQRVTKGVTNR